jgi:hypothetical protein
MKLLITLLLTAALCSCTNGGVGEDRYSVAIDTLTIHGYKHEFIHDYGYGRSGICHSPECWCYQEKCPD